MRQVAVSRVGAVGVVLALVWAVGCGQPECAEGSTRVGDRCVTDVDGSVLDGGDLDASRVDAAPQDAAVALDGAPRPDGAGAPEDGATPVDACEGSPFFRDADLDGFGDPSMEVSACEAPAGYVANADDCGDDDGARNPDASEACDGVDDDCDGLLDEGIPTRAYYRDLDADGFGDAGATEVACSAPSAYVENDDDCDDANEDRYPGAPEVCNDLDDDCDGSTDEGVTTTYYRDADGDGDGAASMPVEACSMPAGYVGNDDDCDDAAATTYAGAPELCNGVDDDCNGTADTPQFACTRGTSTTCTTSCGSAGTGTCTNACARPVGTACTPPAEICGGSPPVDDDCDLRIDEDTLRLRATERYATPPIYDAPVATWDLAHVTPGASSFWLRSGSIYAFHQDAAGDVDRAETLIVASRDRFDAGYTSSGPVLGWVDAAPGANGSVVVIGWTGTTGTERWRQTIAPINTVAGNQFLDVRLFGAGNQVFVFPRAANGLIREVVLNASTGAVEANNTLVFSTSGPFGVSGDAARYAIAAPLASTTGGSHSIRIYLGGTRAIASRFRTIDLGTTDIPREAVVALDTATSPADFVVLWSEAGGGVRIAQFVGEPATGTIRLIQSYTTPPPSAERRHLAISVNRSTYLLGAVEQSTGAAGTPRFYHLPAVTTHPAFVIGSLPTGTHRRIAVLRNNLGPYGRIWHSTTAETGISWTEIGCP